MSFMGGKTKEKGKMVSQKTLHARESETKRMSVRPTCLQCGISRRHTSAMLVVILFTLQFFLAELYYLLLSPL